MYLTTMAHYGMPNGHIMEVIWKVTESIYCFNRKNIHVIWSAHTYPSRDLIKSDTLLSLVPDI